MCLGWKREPNQEWVKEARGNSQEISYGLGARNRSEIREDVEGVELCKTLKVEAKSQSLDQNLSIWSWGFASGQPWHLR